MRRLRLLAAVALCLAAASASAQRSYGYSHPDVAGRETGLRAFEKKDYIAPRSLAQTDRLTRDTMHPDCETAVRKRSDDGHSRNDAARRHQRRAASPSRRRRCRPAPGTPPG